MVTDGYWWLNKKRIDESMVINGDQRWLMMSNGN